MPEPLAAFVPRRRDAALFVWEAPGITYSSLARPHGPSALSGADSPSPSWGLGGAQRARDPAQVAFLSPISLATRLTITSACSASLSPSSTSTRRSSVVLQRSGGLLAPSPYTYNKILFVEKAGLWPVLQAARIAERYDMAIIRGAGEPVEAIRAWLEDQEPGDYEVFALTDSDRHGYGIRHTLSEETWRMPGYSIKVTHLGLSVVQAIEAGVATEKVVYQSACPERVASQLNEVEREWFIGRRTTVWVGSKTRPRYACLRAELNAFAGAALIAFIERRLREEGVSPKVVPPTGVINGNVAEYHRGRARSELSALIDELFKLEDLVDELAAATGGLKVPREDIVKALGCTPRVRACRVGSLCQCAARSDARAPHGRALGACRTGAGTARAASARSNSSSAPCRCTAGSADGPGSRASWRCTAAHRYRPRRPRIRP